MRATLNKPLFRLGLAIVLMLAATEAECYFEFDRHATARELALVLVLASVYFGLLMKFVPQVGHENLYSLLSIHGVSNILRVVEKQEDSLFPWSRHLSRAILWGIVFGFVGASIDTISERRRREKNEESNAEMPPP
jgi:hypothetical protein